MSGLIPREFINDLLTRVDIVELIDTRVPLKKAGRNYQACCPFHDEKTPSFSVSPNKQFYYCFGCGASGNAIGFLINYERIEFIDAIEMLAKQLGLTIPQSQKQSSAVIEKSNNLFDILDAAKKFYRQQLRHSTSAIQYLQSRGLSGEIAKKYGIGYAPAEWDNLLRNVKQSDLLKSAGLIIEKEDRKNYYDRFRDRIMFPIHDRRGRVIGFGGRVLDNSLPKYLNSPETPLFHKSNVLYGLYEARQANNHLQHIIVVEGYMDVVALAQADITFAVATLGTATTSQHVQQLFQQTDTIYFCFDGDRARQTAAWRALEATLPVLQDNTQAHFLFLPEGEDPDSLVRKEGKEIFLARLKSATPLVDFFFAHLKQQGNQHTVENRAKLAHEALFFIDKITAPLIQEMMLDRLAEIVRMERRRLNQFISQIQTKEHTQTSPGKFQKTPMRLAIALLLQHPSLAQEANIDINEFSLPGSEFLQQIQQQINTDPKLNTGSLLEYWRDKVELAYLHKLAAWDHGVPENGLVPEWHGVLAHLQKLQREFTIENLLAKANRAELTETEKLALQALLGER